MRRDRSWAGHFLRTDPPVEIFRAEIPEFERGLLQRRAVNVRHMCDFRGLVVAQDRTQSGYQHQRILNVASNLLMVQVDSRNAVFSKTAAGARKEPHRM